MSDRRKDHVLYIVAAISVMLAAGMVISAFYFGPKLIHADSATAAIRTNTELTSCRAQYNASVTSANAQLIADGFTAALTPTQENTNIVNLDIGVVVAANKAYQAAVKLASMEPDAFLSECRTHPPG